MIVDGRALLLLQASGLIPFQTRRDGSLKRHRGKSQKLRFKSIEAAQLPDTSDVDGAVINGNYALEAGFNP